jgi:hypothetical protein
LTAKGVLDILKRDTKPKQKDNKMEILATAANIAVVSENGTVRVIANLHPLAGRNFENANDCIVAISQSNLPASTIGEIAAQMFSGRN